MSSKKLRKCYFIQYQEKVPFKVCDYSNNTVSVFIDIRSGSLSHTIENISDEDFTNDSETKGWKLWQSFSYLKKFIGKNKNVYKGYTILLNTSNSKHHEYIFIGMHIIKFTMKIPIIKFNSHLSYQAYALTKDTAVIFETFKGSDFNNVGIDEINWRKQSDPYDQYLDMIINLADVSVGNNILSGYILYKLNYRGRKVLDNGKSGISAVLNNRLKRSHALTKRTTNKSNSRIESRNIYPRRTTSRSHSKTRTNKSKAKKRITSRSTGRKS